MNELFYHLDPEDRSEYLDFTGCGNTINCNHPFVARFLLECLEFWVREMHVDGFRLRSRERARRAARTASRS